MGQGSKWCRPSTRLAIYARDGWRCVYCRRGAEQASVGLTLDHLVPCMIGGSNEATNLVTACHSCNSRRQALTVRAFVRRLGAAGAGVADRIRRLVRRPLDRAEGRRLIALRCAS